MLTLDQLNAELINWHSKPGHERFGQYMYNRYFNSRGSWPELFYTENTKTAYTIIFKEITKNVS